MHYIHEAKSIVEYLRQLEQRDNYFYLHRENKMVTFDGREWHNRLTNSLLHRLKNSHLQWLKKIHLHKLNNSQLNRLKNSLLHRLKNSNVHRIKNSLVPSKPCTSRTDKRTVWCRHRRVKQDILKKFGRPITAVHKRYRLKNRLVPSQPCISWTDCQATANSNYIGLKTEKHIWVRDFLQLRQLL